MMNVSGVGVNSLSLLKTSAKSGMTNAVIASASSAEASVNAGKLGSIANKAWTGIKNLGVAAWEKGIKPAAQWVWNKALKPAAEFVWNKALKPVGKAAAKAGKAIWDKAFKPVGEAATKIGKAIWNKALKPAGEAVANLAKKVIGKGSEVSGEVIGAVKKMPKGAKIGLIAAGVVAVATGIGMLIKNHNDKKAEQAEAV